VSPTWQLAVTGTHSAPAMAALPQFADIEGDGYADLLIGSSSYYGLGSIVELPGSSTGVVDVTQSSWSPTTGSSCSAAFVGTGDVNGDGRSDVVAIDCNGVDLFYGTGTGFAAAPDQISAKPGGGAFASMTIPGDVNGDGYADGVAITADSTGRHLAVLPGSASGFGSPLTPVDLPANTGVGLAAVTLPAGDVNNDGYTDVVVSDPGYASGAGRVLVYLGSASGISASPAKIINPPGGITYLSIDEGPTGAGGVTSDVNGDGYLDLLVSTYQTYNTFLVYYGGASGFPSAPSATLSTTGYWAFAGALDVNGDGYGDVAVAAGSTVLVFHGSSSGISATASDTLAVVSNTPGTSGSQGARGVAALGDLDGDTLADFAATVYVPSSSTPLSVYRGSSSSISQTPSFTSTALNPGVLY
jgi:hypothetical protein